MVYTLERFFMKSAEIQLTYFKRGTDMGFCLENTSTANAALDMHVDLLTENISILNGVKELIGDTPVEITADTHWIGINGPDELIDALIKAGYAEAYDEEAYLTKMKSQCETTTHYRSSSIVGSLRQWWNV